MNLKRASSTTTQLPVITKLDENSLSRVEDAQLPESCPVCVLRSLIPCKTLIQDTENAYKTAQAEPRLP